jgi:hypothetical protein
MSDSAFLRGFVFAARATKLCVGPIAALSALACFANATPASAATHEYCRRDVSGHMKSCSFDSLEQCHWAASGIGGDCFRDPSLPADNAFAYARNALRMNTKGYRARTSSKHE